MTLDGKVRIAQFLRSTFSDRDLATTATFLREDYIEHNPIGSANGREGFVSDIGKMLAEFPDATLEVHRIIADSDHVVAHTHWKTGPTEPGFAVVDIYRLDEDGLIAEHWDVVQPLPAAMANPNGAF
ncbi:nuclear transport factor 2 family protein [Nocardia sp. NPDC059246]|uniref:nuclear transport factor 2 family protein n=1 Tax=unclassified Nocardia TaxID=2637762 RepID=UPI0036A70896